MTEVGAGPVDADPVDYQAVRAAARASRRRYLTISWTVTIVVFTLVRLIVVKATLQKYGLNIWIFAAIDLGTAVPYAVGMAKVATALIDRQRGKAGEWAATAAFSFLAPYLYVAWAGHDAKFPDMVWWVLGLVMAAFGANAVWGVIKRVRMARATGLDTPAVPDVVAELQIAIHPRRSRKLGLRFLRKPKL